jgi:hypothetical protein
VDFEGDHEFFGLILSNEHASGEEISLINK